LSCSRDPRFDSHGMFCSVMTHVYLIPFEAFREYDCFPKICIPFGNMVPPASRTVTQNLSLWRGSSLHWALLLIRFENCTLFFDNKDNFVGSFYYSTCKFDRANDEFNRTRRFETSHNCCHQERFQMFITTPIGATSMHFVVKRDLQNFGSTCGSLRKSFWRHDIKNTQPHLKRRKRRYRKKI